jgi:predicted transposase YbfD/YdcC
VDPELGEYVAQELGFPGVQQVGLLEKERITIATGEVSQEHWYVLSSLSPAQCSAKRLLQLCRGHWSIENSQHHVKDRSWDEDRHMLRRPGLGEVFAILVNASLNALRLAGWFPANMSMPLRAKSCAFSPTDTITRLAQRH